MILNEVGSFAQYKIDGQSVTTNLILWHNMSRLLPGTPPNLILVGFLTSQFPEHSLNFGSWMAFALPEVFTQALYQ